MKQLPNLLSVSRIVLALSCLFLFSCPTAFFTCYFLAGFTDVADGWIARRYHLESRLGAKLDSLGDLVFWICIFAVCMLHTQLFRQEAVLLAAGGAFLARVVNAVLTRVKFRQWGMLHTWGNQGVGLLLFVFLPLAAFEILPAGALAWLAGGAAVLSALEELVILLLSPEYLPDRKGIWDR